MKITDLDKMKIEEQKKAVRSGYDMDIIPSDLATFGGEAKRLLQDLQTRDVYTRQHQEQDTDGKESGGLQLHVRGTEMCIRDRCISCQSFTI